MTAILVVVFSLFALTVLLGITAVAIVAVKHYRDQNQADRTLRSDHGP